jgi:hypothetical protein
VAATGEPVVARANPQAGRLQPGKTPRNIAGIPSPQISPVLAAGANEGEGLPDAQERKEDKSRFPPKKGHSTQDPTETFQPPNDLAENRPN